MRVFIVRTSAVIGGSVHRESLSLVATSLSNTPARASPYETAHSGNTFRSIPWWRDTNGFTRRFSIWKRRDDHERLNPTMRSPATTLEASSAATLTCFATNSTATARTADACCGKYASNWKNFISNRKAQPGRASLVRQFNNPVSCSNKVQYSINSSVPQCRFMVISPAWITFSRDGDRKSSASTIQRPLSLRQRKSQLLCGCLTALLGLGQRDKCIDRTTGPCGPVGAGAA